MYSGLDVIMIGEFLSHKIKCINLMVNLLNVLVKFSCHFRSSNRCTMGSLYRQGISEQSMIYS
jgi:hypothetical protein